MESVISSKSTHRGIISYLYIKTLRQSFCWKANLQLQVPQTSDFPQNVASFINYCMTYLLGSTPPTCTLTAEWIQLKSVRNLWRCFDVKCLITLSSSVKRARTCRWKLSTCKHCLQGDQDEHFGAGLPVWCWGTRELAGVAWRLWLVCLDENTISLFVLCHCLKQNLGCGICWHFLDSCSECHLWGKERGREREKKRGDTYHEPSARKSMEAWGVCWKYSNASFAVTV